MLGGQIMSRARAAGSVFVELPAQAPFNTRAPAVEDPEVAAEVPEENATPPPSRVIDTIRW